MKWCTDCQQIVELNHFHVAHLHITGCNIVEDGNSFALIAPDFSEVDQAWRQAISRSDQPLRPEEWNVFNQASRIIEDKVEQLRLCVTDTGVALEGKSRFFFSRWVMICHSEGWIHGSGDGV